VLRQKAKKIKTFGPQTASLADEMLESMNAADGLGLAAPQIGVPRRLIIIQMPGEANEEGEETEPGELYVYCNPEIIEASGEEEGSEGCLSVVGFVGQVKRATAVTVKGEDVKGRKIRTKATGLLARAFQHEIDHLDGVLYIDRIDSPEKLRRVGENEGTEDGLIE
jgi:peptide deformylase